ncbi:MULTISPECIES: envelope stress response membrane protein PspB [Inquilinus]|jgi:phage shock protein B|uniref:Phage shock protein B n=1 Tax=Inquilinus ginsengisoli TaxID=363840 RepID=A0ABU1K2T1_9PROT|nr:envelope stress response membrane protein PspB [Inquilinus ginsengisoli]MDR6294094.1 phage shock protein B [Inquilinus ginsengisoli]
MFHAIVFVPVIIFLVIVAPIWLVLHYVTRWRSSRTLSREDERMLVDLWESAKRMELRIQTLEKILDAEAPQWRRPGP